MKGLCSQIVWIRLSVTFLAIIVFFTAIPVSIFATSSTEVMEIECSFLHDYMRRDFNNDPVEVLKLQAFLINFEGHQNVSLTGVFDQATFDAVSVFQMKYFSDILEPWGLTRSTGYVYITTLKKVNEIYCQRIFPLNEDQIKEINAYKAFQLPSSPSETIEGTDISTTTLPALPTVGKVESSQGQNLRNLAAVLLAQPDTLGDIMKCLYGLLLILIVLYIIGSVLKDVLYKDVPENSRKRFLTKWFAINLGIVAAIILAYIFGWWCLVLPLIIALTICLVWMLLYPEHNSMKASAKSWYLVGSLRVKSILKKEKEAPKEVIIIRPKK
ncbi:MAG: peptidoglycan-binding domain-containing protein [bacterium]|nr:peptidoglycan-binding domain-containing protein [bacterium]